MIAIDQMPPIGQRVDCAMREGVRGEALARRTQCRIVRDPSERDDHAHVRQRRKLALEIVPFEWVTFTRTAIPDKTKTCRCDTLFDEIVKNCSCSLHGKIHRP